MRYFVVDGVDALKKFGDDAWYVTCCASSLHCGTDICISLQGQSGLRDDYGASLAIQAIQMARAEAVIPSWYVS
jgi:hypothetical protein